MSCCTPKRDPNFPETTLPHPADGWLRKLPPPGDQWARTVRRDARRTVLAGVRARRATIARRARTAKKPRNRP